MLLLQQNEVVMLITSHCQHALLHHILQRSWKTTSVLKGADRCFRTDLGQWVDGGVQHLACVLYFLTVQAALEETHPKGLGHPPVCKLTSQDVLVLQAAPQRRYADLVDRELCCDPTSRMQSCTEENPKVDRDTCSATTATIQCSSSHETTENTAAVTAGSTVTTSHVN